MTNAILQHNCNFMFIDDGNHFRIEVLWNLNNIPSSYLLLNALLKLCIQILQPNPLLNMLTQDGLVPKPPLDKSISEVSSLKTAQNAQHFFSCRSFSINLCMEIFQVPKKNARKNKWYKAPLSSIQDFKSFRCTNIRFMCNKMLTQ